MSPFVVVDVNGWWDSTHYTARVIAIRPTEAGAIEAMWTHARSIHADGGSAKPLDIDEPDEWERDAVGLTVTRDGGHEAYRIEQPEDKRVTT